MSLLEKIDADIKKAMLAKEDARLRALRAIKSALLIARTEKGGAGEINEEVEQKILSKQIKQRRESADIYTAQNRPDLAKIELDELAVIGSYLPEQLSSEHVKAALQKIIQSTGASSIKDIGKVMAVASRELAGKADGKLIAETVKQLLA